MSDDKSIMLVKESFLKKIFNKIKKFFIKANKETYEKTITEKTQLNNNDRKNNFLNNIKIQENSDIIYLKIKLENGEIRAIDLNDEQIDELQKIYDKEILEKQEKIRKLKAVA